LVRGAGVVVPQKMWLHELKMKMDVVIPQKAAQVARIKKEYGDRVLGHVTVEQAYGGARDVNCLICETSLLDPIDGIRFRGMTIPELCQKLPKAQEQPLVEGILWLLLTGEIPTAKEVEQLRVDLVGRSEVPSYVLDLIKNLPKDLHPMSQFSIAVTALQRDSLFAHAYARGVHKKEYWHYTYEDSLNLIAKIPTITATIYNHTFHNDRVIPSDKGLDFGANLAKMMGFNNPAFTELLRLYLVIHSDHEGGNVSAHTTHLVGSALSDPYLSFAAGLNGLAGPLHGLANQEVLFWLQDFKEHHNISDHVELQEVEEACWATLNAGKVIPGFGHAVLRRTDPRYLCFREFGLKNLPNDPLMKLVSALFEVAPKVLTKQGKTKNPWPNVDAHSGVLLQHFGLTQAPFYTVLFGVSRALGVLSSLVWDRALGFPIERPKSFTTDSVEEFCKTHPK
jgi:citrate synthase